LPQSGSQREPGRSFQMFREFSVESLPFFEG
jgi:hypothetical protein